MESRKTDRRHGTLLAWFLLASVLIGGAFYLLIPLLNLFGED
jgi:hypothetical protein